MLRGGIIQRHALRFALPLASEALSIAAIKEIKFSDIFPSCLPFSPRINNGRVDRPGMVILISECTSHPRPDLILPGLEIK